MAFRVLNGHDEVEAYARRLDEGWPDRVEIAAHICARLERVGIGEPRILEFCTGPGALAAAVLAAIPVSEYVSVDVSAPSLEYASQRVAHQAAKTTWLQADLNEDGWQSQVENGFDAVISMQSVHDLGAEREVARIYGIARTLLRSRGQFINADLLRSRTDPPESNPGRFTVSKHLELLHAAGFEDERCTLQLGGFGCFEAFAGGGNDLA